MQRPPETLAFPGRWHYGGGITLLEWYASQALPAVTAFYLQDREALDRDRPQLIALYAHRIAEAMLNAQS
jgi:hypothetical protein